MTSIYLQIYWKIKNPFRTHTLDHKHKIKVTSQQYWSLFLHIWPVPVTCRELFINIYVKYIQSNYSVNNYLQLWILMNWTSIPASMI